MCFVYESTERASDLIQEIVNKQGVYMTIISFRNPIVFHSSKKIPTTSNATETINDVVTENNSRTNAKDSFCLPKSILGKSNKKNLPVKAPEFQAVLSHSQGIRIKTDENASAVNKSQAKALEKLILAKLGGEIHGVSEKIINSSTSQTMQHIAFVKNNDNANAVDVENKVLGLATIISGPLGCSLVVHDNIKSKLSRKKIAEYEHFEKRKRHKLMHNESRANSEQANQLLARAPAINANSVFSGIQSSSTGNSPCLIHDGQIYNYNFLTSSWRIAPDNCDIINKNIEQLSTQANGAVYATKGNKVFMPSNPAFNPVIAPYPIEQFAVDSNSNCFVLGKKSLNSSSYTITKFDNAGRQSEVSFFNIVDNGLPVKPAKLGAVSHEGVTNLLVVGDNGKIYKINCSSPHSRPVEIPVKDFEDCVAVKDLIYEIDQDSKPDLRVILRNESTRALYSAKYEQGAVNKENRIDTGANFRNETGLKSIEITGKEQVALKNGFFKAAVREDKKLYVQRQKGDKWEDAGLSNIESLRTDPVGGGMLYASRISKQNQVEVLDVDLHANDQTHQNSTDTLHLGTIRQPVGVTVTQIRTIPEDTRDYSIGPQNRLVYIDPDGNIIEHNKERFPTLKGADAINVRVATNGDIYVLGVLHDEPEGTLENEIPTAVYKLTKTAVKNKPAGYYWRQCNTTREKFGEVLGLDSTNTGQILLHVFKDNKNILKDLDGNEIKSNDKDCFTCALKGPFEYSIFHATSQGAVSLRNALMALYAELRLVKNVPGMAGRQIKHLLTGKMDGLAHVYREANSAQKENIGLVDKAFFVTNLDKNINAIGNGQVRQSLSLFKDKLLQEQYAILQQIGSMKGAIGSLGGFRNVSCTKLEKISNSIKEGAKVMAFKKPEPNLLDGLYEFYSKVDGADHIVELIEKLKESGVKLRQPKDDLKSIYQASHSGVGILTSGTGQIIKALGEINGFAQSGIQRKQLDKYTDVFYKQSIQNMICSGLANYSEMHEVNNAVDSLSQALRDNGHPLTKLIFQDIKKLPSDPKKIADLLTQKILSQPSGSNFNASIKYTAGVTPGGMFFPMPNVCVMAFCSADRTKLHRLLIELNPDKQNVTISLVNDTSHDFLAVANAGAYLTKSARMPARAEGEIDISVGRGGSGNFSFQLPRENLSKFIETMVDKKSVKGNIFDTVRELGGTKPAMMVKTRELSLDVMALTEVKSGLNKEKHGIFGQQGSLGGENHNGFNIFNKLRFGGYMMGVGTTFAKTKELKREYDQIEGCYKNRFGNNVDFSFYWNVFAGLTDTAFFNQDVQQNTFDPSANDQLMFWWRYNLGLNYKGTQSVSNNSKYNLRPTTPISNIEWNALVNGTKELFEALPDYHAIENCNDPVEISAKLSAIIGYLKERSKTSEFTPEQAARVEKLETRLLEHKAFQKGVPLLSEFVREKVTDAARINSESMKEKMLNLFRKNQKTALPTTQIIKDSPNSNLADKLLAIKKAGGPMVAVFKPRHEALMEFNKKVIDGIVNQDNVEKEIEKFSADYRNNCRISEIYYSGGSVSKSTGLASRLFITAKHNVTIEENQPGGRLEFNYKSRNDRQISSFAVTGIHPRQHKEERNLTASLNRSGLSATTQPKYDYPSTTFNRFATRSGNGR